MSAGALAPPARLDLPEALCPFRGLVPFSERDAEYFFGRTAEREIIAANLIAAPLTLLYSASGVGKSSVLRAGVMGDLVDGARATARDGYGPEYIPALVRDWRADPLAALRRGLVDGVRSVLGDEAADDPVEADDVVGEIVAWSKRTGATMLVILDQFEEFLLYHGEHWGPGEPAVELAAALCLDARVAGFLLALREDALAGLDRFKGRVPGLFDNYLRLRQLSVKEAATAITGPVGRWNDRHPDDRMAIEPDLVREVVSQVGDGRLALTGSGQGRPAGSADGGVEAPFLQLVMTRVWEAERGRGSAVLRYDTLGALGGARNIVAGYLDEQMNRLSRAERDVASDVFHQLVTPSGTKVARTVRDLTAYTGASEETLGEVLGKLSQGEEWRILRPEPDPRGGGVTYEIFHDVLADPVLDWRSRHEATRAGERAMVTARARTRRRILWGLAALPILVALVALGILYVLQARDQKKAADEARTAAATGAAVAASGNALASDPELSVLLAQEALKLDPHSVPGKRALRAALGDNRSLGVLGRSEPDWDFVELNRDATLASATSDTRVRVYSLTGRKLLYTADVDYGYPMFDPSGTKIAVPRPDGVDVRDAVTGKVIRTLRDSGAVYWAQWSPDGRRLLGDCGGGACIWSAANGRLQRRVAVPSLRLARWAGSHRLAILGAHGVAVQDLRDGAARRLDPDFPVQWFRVSKDGSTMLASAGPTLWKWDLRTGATRRLDARDAGGVIGLDAHGDHVLLSGTGGRALVWDTRTHSPSVFLNGHSGDISSGWMSDDGTVAMTGGSDRTARLWDLRTGTQLAVLGHGSAVGDLAASPSGIVVTVDMAGVVREWQLWPSAGPSLSEPGTRVSSAALGGDGHTIVAATSRGVRVWDTRRAGSAPRPLGGTSAVKQATLSPDGRSVLVVGPRMATVLGLADGRRIGSPLGVDLPKDSVTRAAFSPDGKLIVTAQRDGAAAVWSADDHRFRRRLGLPVTPSPYNELNDVAFSADSRLVAVAGGDRVVRVYDVRDGEAASVFKFPNPGVGTPLPESDAVTAVRAVALQPHGTLVAAGDDDGVVNVWDRKDRAFQLTLTVSGRVNALAFSADGTLLATAAGSDAKLWEISTGRMVSSVSHGVRHVTGLRFSRDGRKIVLAADGRIETIDCELCGTAREMLDAAARDVHRELTAKERGTWLSGR
jgi:WD40 repeat protein